MPAKDPVKVTTTNVIAGARSNLQYFLDGRLDDAAIWGRALSAKEIELVWNRGKGIALDRMSGEILAAETFDTDSTDLATDYPDYTLDLGGVGSARVSAGQLDIDLPSNQASSVNQTFLTDEIFSGPLKIFGLIGETADSATTASNVGLVFGTNRFVTLPGYDPPGTPLGKVYIGTASGSGFNWTGFDTDFAIEQGILHKMEVETDGLGNFSFTFTDGNDPTNVLTGSFSNPANTVFPVGFGFFGASQNTSLFDNLMVLQVPEPCSVVLLVTGLAAVALLVHRRRRGI